ncbi:MAG TPA: RDD family protein [Longimicrobiales bacterium]|nr:RDD family protein [Longimicrobiales bacterium]
MASDPRDTITPDAFTVAPELLGTPLAKPSRRGVAMAIDLVLVSLMIKLIGTMIAAVVAILLFMRLAKPDATGGRIGRGSALSLRFWIVLLVCFFVYLTVRSIAGGMTNRGNADRDDDDASYGMEHADWRQYVQPGDGTATPDSAGLAPVLEFASLIEAGDTVGADSLRSDAVQSLAGPTLAAMDARADSLRELNVRLRDELDEAREGIGFRRVLSGLSEDLGVGFGWMAVYFTAFLVLWQGQTPGKRLLGMRVIRLDGRPLSWWISFERFGGYAASFSIGLLGFLQILWDRNRQGLHDKAVETVVIRLPR